MHFWPICCDPIPLKHGYFDSPWNFQQELTGFVTKIDHHIFPFRASEAVCCWVSISCWGLSAGLHPPHLLIRSLARIHWGQLALYPAKWGHVTTPAPSEGTVTWPVKARHVTRRGAIRPPRNAFFHSKNPHYYELILSIFKKFGTVEIVSLSSTSRDVCPKNQNRGSSMRCPT